MSGPEVYGPSGPRLLAAGPLGLLEFILRTLLALRRSALGKYLQPSGNISGLGKSLGLVIGDVQPIRSSLAGKY